MQRPEWGLLESGSIRFPSRADAKRPIRSVQADRTAGPAAGCGGTRGRKGSRQLSAGSEARRLRPLVSRAAAQMTVMTTATMLAIWYGMPKPMLFSKQM